MKTVAILTDNKLRTLFAKEKIIEIDYSTGLQYYPEHANLTSIPWNVVFLNDIKVKENEKIAEMVQSTYCLCGNNPIVYNGRDLIDECRAKVANKKDSCLISHANGESAITFIWSDIIAESNKLSTSQTLERIIMMDSNNTMIESPNLRKLNLGGCVNFTDDGLKNLTKLVEFHSGCSNFTDKAFTHLTSLRRLYLQNTDNISYQGLSHLKLEMLMVDRASHLAECEELKPILQYFE
jgi:hypothetical protein